MVISAIFHCHLRLPEAPAGSHWVNCPSEGGMDTPRYWPLTFRHLRVGKPHTAYHDMDWSGGYGSSLEQPRSSPHYRRRDDWFKCWEGLSGCDWQKQCHFNFIPPCALKSLRRGWSFHFMLVSRSVLFFQPFLFRGRETHRHSTHSAGEWSNESAGGSLACGVKFFLSSANRWFLNFFAGFAGLELNLKSLCPKITHHHVRICHSPLEL